MNGFFAAIFSVFCLLAPIATCADKVPDPTTLPTVKFRPLVAREVFNYGQVILFQDDFASGEMAKWRFSENDNYQIAEANPNRIKIVDAAGLQSSCKAVRFAVERAPNSFRSEISLPSEAGFQERWYAERILVPSTWVSDPVRGNDILMQWHGIPGNGQPTYPNLEISVGNRNWYVRQSFGNAKTKPTRTDTKLEEPVKAGAWVSWVVHAKWSPQDDGTLQIWRDGKIVVDHKGPNVYSDIGMEYTPYLKTGIYHPQWHLDKDEKRLAFENEKPTAMSKTIYVTDVKVGSERANYDDVAPKP